MAYKAPIWEDGKSPAISAENLNNLSQAVEGAQVLYGNSAPTSSTEGAVGQFYLVVVADSDGNYALYQCVAVSGSTYTWKSLGVSANSATISDIVAQVLGLPTGSTVAEALIAAPSPRKIASYETAGSYTWTAPDLNSGKSYKIGVFIIGAGAAGSAAASSSSKSYYLPGGGSGFTMAIALIVSPGESKALVVGAGGTSPATTTFVSPSKSGGSSSFAGAVAGGGQVPVNSSSWTNAQTSLGSNDGTDEEGAFGGTPRDAYDKSGRPDQCLNPFENTRIMGSGGGAHGTTTGNAFPGGKDPITGLGGGDGVYANGVSVVGKPGTTPGSGGGAAYSYGGPSASGGAGADGAVYIYFLGVADE